ncbi:hypothetical protein VTH82DRAFT_5560 [Thermothelomyces myriococcoides]
MTRSSEMLPVSSIWPEPALAASSLRRVVHTPPSSKWHARAGTTHQAIAILAVLQMATRHAGTHPHTHTLDETNANMILPSGLVPFGVPI